MLTASALVLMMTAPGLALFYCGLVRKKNVLGVMMQCFFLMGMMTVLWCLYGYSLAFGGSGRWIGDGSHILMKGLEMQHGIAPIAGSVPALTFMVFQGMFFIITPALICGAFAERMKFSTMCVFMILWGTLVYCPICHWVWHENGFLFHGAEGAFMGGALDFAGGTVVHISSGVSALICALLIGKRLGFGSDPMPPHNLTYTTIGGALLWVGWFGFNAGSAVSAGGSASNAFVVTHFSAAAGAVAWALMEWITRGKPTLLGTVSGAVAGLVGITPASGFVQPWAALLIGLAAGVICFYACTTIKNKCGYDDSLDAFGVHGIGGTVGAVLTGVFATMHVTGDDAPLGVVDGPDGWSLVASQIGAVAVTFVLAIVVTFIILKVLDATMGLRVTQEDEVQGLDQSQHGEEGYIFI
ncbi:MAG: ammonium transporter [Pirellulales bacterium]|nr:ammonium transporter [Pirellulales bacterium]